MGLGRIGSWVGAGILAAGLLGAGLVAAMGRWGVPGAGDAWPRRGASRASIGYTTDSRRGEAGVWGPEGSMA